MGAPRCGVHHSPQELHAILAAREAALWSQTSKEQAARLAHLRGEIAAGRLVGFDASDKGKHAIVEAGSARCTGKEGWGWVEGFEDPGVEDEEYPGEFDRSTPRGWSVACGKPINRGDDDERRITFKAVQAWEAFIGVMLSTASREVDQTGQRGSIGLRSDGFLIVDGVVVPMAVKGFHHGDTVAVAVLRAGGGRVVALYVNDEEVARQALPKYGEYRFAVGGDKDFDAFEIVDTREWSPRAHKHLSPATRARAVALMRLGHLLSLQHADEKQGALRELWREVVLPMAMLA